MKVKIGKYPRYFSPYLLSENLKIFGIPEDKCNWVGEWLSDCDWLTRLFEWINEKNKRKIKVQIDDYDVWSMDHTLALVVSPMLKRLQKLKHGSAIVADSDVPAEYVSKDVHERWDWVIGEMMFAFDQIADEDIDVQYSNTEIRDRVNNGLRLFGTYYFALWD